MSAPRCRVCGVSEWRHACFSGAASRATLEKVVERKVAGVGPVKPPPAEPRVSHAAPVSHGEAVSQSTTYRYRDAAARRQYQRDLMRSRRRAARRVSA